MPDRLTPEDIQAAAEFGTRMIPLVLKIRQARDKGTGVTLEPEEVTTLIEVLRLLRQGDPRV